MKHLQQLTDYDAMTSGSDPMADNPRLLRELPSGVALFDGEGRLEDANAVFLKAIDIGTDEARGIAFERLFGATPSTFAAPGAQPIPLPSGHYAVCTRWVEEWGWLCQLQDVSTWVDATAAADASAGRDELSGLANRNAIMPLIAQAAADASHSASLLMIDLDRFKAVNDTLGHPMGDALLRKVGDRLTA